MKIHIFASIDSLNYQKPHILYKRCIRILNYNLLYKVLTKISKKLNIAHKPTELAPLVASLTVSLLNGVSINASVVELMQ